MDSVESSDPAPAPTVVRLTGWEALKLHLTLGVGLGLCVAGFSFEIHRALGGNALSWAYVFEWPLFAGFAIYMWWNLLHRGRVRRRPPPPPRVAPEHLGMLKAWQEHQRALAATETVSTRPKPAAAPTSGRPRSGGVTSPGGQTLP
jgi:hypothetical protein